MQEKTETISHLICKNRNKAKLICCSEQCNNCALVCRNEDCQCLPNEHIKCEFLYTEHFVKQIQSKRGVMSLQVQKAVQKVDKVYMEAIETLSIYREGLQLWKENFGLNSQESQLLDLINTNQRDKITGSLVFKVKSHLDDKKQYSNLNEGWVDEFWNEGRLKFQRLFSRVNDFHRQYLQQKNSENYLKLDSLITDNILNLTQLFDKPIAEFKLLYRASQNNFSVKKFHQNCDNIPNTLTLLKTEHDKIIGGFTPVTWENLANGASKADPTSESFIFSLSLNEKYQVIDPHKAIRNYQNYGPAFGIDYNKYDLCIVDRADLHQSTFNFPHGYNNGKYMNSQKSYYAFAGSANGSGAKIKQWQVFHVQWKQ